MNLEKLKKELEEAKNKTKIAWNLFLITGLLVACGSSPVEATKPVLDKTEPAVQVYPTPTEMTVAPATATPEVNYFAGGGQYDDVQKAWIEALRDNRPEASQKMKSWEMGIKDYLKYWAGSNTVGKEMLEKEVPVIWFWDESDSHNPEKVTACIDISSFGGDCFSLPIVNGRPQLVAPTEYVDGQNEMDQGPLPLIKTKYAPNSEQLFLGASNGSWVNRDKPNGQDGLAREALDIKGYWIPVYGIETVKPEVYSAEQIDLINKSPTVNKEGLPLVKGYATGPFFTEMFYFGAGDEVKAIYDKETNQVHPAMMWGANDMLVVNYRSDFTYSLNPNMKGESPAQIMRVIPDYFRAKACLGNKNVEIPTDLNELQGNQLIKDLASESCTVKLNVYGDDKGYFNLRIVGEMPIFIKVVDKKEKGMGVMQNQGDIYNGWKYENINDVLIMTILREQGVVRTAPKFQTTEDVANALSLFFDFQNRSIGYVIRKYLFDELTGEGRLGSQDTELAIISGSKLDIVY